MWCAFATLPRFFRPIPSISPPRNSSFPTFCSRGVSAAVFPAIPSPEKLEFRSSELVAREYAELNLSNKFCQEVGHVRIRQHVNPLRSDLMVPVELPDWNAVYKDATLP